MASPTTAPIDGRTARAARTRDAVVDALLSLLSEGSLRPTGARIAERAGVSLRSVFQHFDDLEALFAAVAARQAGRIDSMRAPVPSTGPVDARVRAVVDQRALVYEFIAPVRRAAILQEPFSPTLQRGRDRLDRAGASELSTVFSRELDALDRTSRRDVTAALWAATSWESWEHLRTHQQLGVVGAKRAMARTITALLS
jgi:AcrR family transcriptional regulator